MEKKDYNNDNKNIAKYIVACVLVLALSIVGVLSANRYLNPITNQQVLSKLDELTKPINNEQDDVHRYIAVLNNKLQQHEINLNEGYIQISELFNQESDISEMKYAENLKAGWIKVENNAVNEYTFYFSSCMVSRIRYCEYVDESKNIVHSEYRNTSEVNKTYKYEEEYRVVGEAGLNYTDAQSYNTLKYNEATGKYEYTGQMKYYNIEDYVGFGDPSDYGECENPECTGCVDCIKDWTRCIKKATDEAMVTGGVVYFPTREYLVDLDDDSGLEYEILPNGTRSSFDAHTTRNNRGRGIFLNGNYITYTDNVIDTPRGFAPIIIDLCGSKLKLEKNHMANYSVIEVRNCKYFEIKNGTVQGDRMEHDYTDFLYDGIRVNPQSGDAGDHTQGYGISVRSTENAIISNMDVYDATADALCFNKSVLWINYETGDCIGNETHVEVKYTYAHHSRRQGITVGDIDSINIHHTEIAHIGGGNILNSDGTYSLEIGWANAEDEQKYGSRLTEEEKNMIGTLGVGRSPMAGIDIEPDRGSRKAEEVRLNNLYIHETDGFAIVGVGRSTDHHTTSDLVLSNSFVDGIVCLSEDQDEYVKGVFYPAESILLKNNIILHSDPVVQYGYELDENLQGEKVVWCAFETTNLTYLNCIVRKTYKGHMSYFNVSNTYDGCLIEQDQENTIYLNNPTWLSFTPNGYFSFAEGCNITNTTFKNIIGAQVNSTDWRAHGAVFKEGGLAENYGNTFENCSVIFNAGTIGSLTGQDLTDPDKTTKFIGGHIDLYSSGKSIFNNCSFVKTSTRALTLYLELNYCVMLNTETIFGDWDGDARAERYINNCYFHFDSESMFASRLSRGTHWGGVWKNSVLRIEGDVNVSNRKCKYTDETKAHPHFTFLQMTDLDDVAITQISLNENMQNKASLIYRNNEYSTKDTSHTGSHDYAGLCFYESNEWLAYVKKQSSTNENKIYKLAHEAMLENGYFNKK